MYYIGELHANFGIREGASVVYLTANRRELYTNGGHFVTRVLKLVVGGGLP